MNSDRNINWLRVFEVTVHVALLVGLTAAAARVSYSELQEAAESSRVPYPQLWAALLDGAAVSLALIVWSLRRRGERAPGARLLLYGATALSTVLQVSAAPPVWRDQIIHAVPPLLVLALFEQILRVLGRPAAAPAPLPVRVRAWWSTTAGASEVVPAVPAGEGARPELVGPETGQRALGPAARGVVARDDVGSGAGRDRVAGQAPVPARVPSAQSEGDARTAAAARPVVVEDESAGSSVPAERVRARHDVPAPPARRARSVAAGVERVGTSMPVERPANRPPVPARLEAVGEAVRRLEAEGREVNGTTVGEVLGVEASNARKKLRAYRQAVAEAEGVPA